MSPLEKTTPVAAAVHLAIPPAPVHFPEAAQAAAPVALSQNSGTLQARHTAGGLTPTTLDEAYRLAEFLADSTMVPKDYQGKPGNVLVAIQWGMELGLKPLQAMQNIAVINGRPSLWGDAVLALVLGHGSCEDVIEQYEGTGDQKKAVCIAKRRGREDKVGEFSMADARKAGLLSKSGPWQQYPERMLKMRARAFALRDQFADVLKGIAVAEEQQDVEPSYFAESGPDSRLDGGSSRPAPRPAPVKAAQVIAQNAPQLTEDGAAEIVRLTRIARTEGYTAFRAAWTALTEAMRAEIGIPKRNEMGALAAEFDQRKKGEAVDATIVTPEGVAS